MENQILQYLIQLGSIAAAGVAFGITYQKVNYLDERLERIERSILEIQNLEKRIFALEIRRGRRIK